MEVDVRIRGRGRVAVSAYGMADAEHLVEKEIGRLWPGARVQVTEVARSGEQRIVEEFEISYRVEGTLRVSVTEREEAPGAAFRRARGLFAESRFRRTEWEALEVKP